MTQKVETTVVAVQPSATVDLGTLKSTETITTGGSTTSTKIEDKISFTAPTTGTAQIIIPKTDANGAPVSQALAVTRDTEAVEKETTINKAQNLESIVTSSNTSVSTVSKEDLAKPETVVSEVPVATVERIFTGEPSGTKFEGAPLTITSPAPTGVANNEVLPMTLLTSEDGII